MRTRSFGHLLRRIRQSISRLTYYGAYVDAMRRLDNRSALEDLGRITDTIEHELRNPLMLIDACIDQMTIRGEHDERTVEMLEEMQHQLRRIYFSLGIIHLFAKEAPPLYLCKTDAGDLIKTAIEDFKRDFQHADSITFKLDDRTLFIRADSEKLKRAVLCAFKNSLEAIRKAKRTRGLISINLITSQEMAAIEILDNGCGISAEHIARVRELFRSNSYGDVKQGLGLLTAARILDLHDGVLKIRSDPGKGTRLSLTLPRWID